MQSMMSNYEVKTGQTQKVAVPQALSRFIEISLIEKSQSGKTSPASKNSDGASSGKRKNKKPKKSLSIKNAIPITFKKSLRSKMKDYTAPSQKSEEAKSCRVLKYLK